jgi:hypothetical protein
LLPIFAHPPALVIYVSLLYCCLEFLFRLTLRNGFRRIEAREVLADDFVNLVAFDAISAFISTNDLPLRVQHEDRIILLTFDQ